jgi:hypothetical protein
MTATDNQTRLIELLSEVMREKGLAVPPLGPEVILDQLGLESLDFAQVVIRMEELTGKDPFASGQEFQILTLADFSLVYD